MIVINTAAVTSLRITVDDAETRNRNFYTRRCRADVENPARGSVVVLLFDSQVGRAQTSNRDTGSNFQLIS